MKTALVLPGILLSLSLVACGESIAPPPAPTESPATASAAESPAPEPASSTEAPLDPAVEPVNAFLGKVATLCGKAFAGRVVVDTPAQPENAFAGKTLIMHVRECSGDEVKIPFHVGDDHSRTWVLTRTPDGLRLKHDHRHQDGSDDAVTMYGGTGAGLTAGTDARQAFPVDAESVDTFKREGLNASVTNTWAMEIEPDSRFLYELARPGGRLFQVEFDLTKPVDLPPAPWGHPEID